MIADPFFFMDKLGQIPPEGPSPRPSRHLRKWTVLPFILILRELAFHDCSLFCCWQNKKAYYIREFWSKKEP